MLNKKEKQQVLNFIKLIKMEFYNLIEFTNPILFSKHFFAKNKSYNFSDKYEFSNELNNSYKELIKLKKTLFELKIPKNFGMTYKEMMKNKRN